MDGTNYGDVGYHCFVKFFAQNFTHVYILRFLLGMAEAGFSRELFIISHIGFRQKSGPGRRHSLW